MLISPRHKVLFVHVQKTGGITIGKLLRERIPDARHVRGLPDRRHSTLEAALQAHPELADYWKFGAVRNPWARLYSWYSMAVARTEGKDPSEYANNPFYAGVAQHASDFEWFVMKGPEEFDRLRRPQVDYLRGPSGEVDFVARTETLSEDLKVVYARLGWEDSPEDAPRRNVGSHGSYRDAYTPAMRDNVARVFAADIEAFGYEF